MSELSKSMAAAFPKIQGAVAQKINPQFGSKYADLASIIEAIKPALAEHGLWFMQKIHNEVGIVSVETVIMHESGESLPCGVVSIPVCKPTAQGYGSALTYARRYSLSAAFGVAPEDDDGNEASEVPKSGSSRVAKSFNPPSEKQEVKILGQEELKLRAEQVHQVLFPDSSINNALEVSDIINFLDNWQKSKPGMPNFNKYLSDGKDKLLEAIYNWKAKQAESAQ